MVIWKNIATIKQLNTQTIGTLAETLAIKFVEIGHNYLKASMPVNATVHQPYGILHGGASAALAETVGSVGSWLCIDDQHICVGMEINCNHIKSVRSGWVTATAKPFHMGATSHVWDIQIRDEKEKLVCVSRLTMAILKNRNR
ncbi:MAG TPA: hotdog fold thioesterase [Flavipsychrobacter sp.]|nr:hotdog fold thioesterase [Flavipsychrobacter sp.]